MYFHTICMTLFASLVCAVSVSPAEDLGRAIKDNSDGILVLSAGQYTIDPITLTNDLSIVGDEAGGTVLRIDAASANPFTYASELRIQFANITLKTTDSSCSILNPHEDHVLDASIAHHSIQDGTITMIIDLGPWFGTRLLEDILINECSLIHQLKVGGNTPILHLTSHCHVQLVATVDLKSLSNCGVSSESTDEGIVYHLGLHNYVSEIYGSFPRIIDATTYITAQTNAVEHTQLTLSSTAFGEKTLECTIEERIQAYRSNEISTKRRTDIELACKVVGAKAYIIESGGGDILRDSKLYSPTVNDNPVHGRLRVLQAGSTNRTGSIQTSLIHASAGDALAGVPVQLVDKESIIVDTVITNEKGNVLFEGTRPGTYTIRVPAGVNDVVHGLVSLSYDSQAVQPNDGSKTVTVKEGSHLNAGDFTYNVPGTLSGILTVGTYDNPIPNIAVKLLGAEGVVAASTTTNTKGRYSFKELLVGSYSVTVPQTIPNYRTTLKSEPFAGDATLDGIYTCKLTVQEPSIANVNYHYGQVSEYAEEPETVSGGLNSITGGIYSGSEASPLEGIEVELTDDETGKVVASTKTNANGQYGFLKVTPNKYYLVSTPATNPEARTEVLSRDYYDMQHSGTRTPMFFNAGRLLAHVDFVYAPPNQISGNIRDASGAGLAGVKVVLSHPNRLITTVQSTDTNGHYTFVNITKGGNYMINIAKPQEYTYLFDCYDEEYKHSLLDGESTVPYTGTSVSGVDFFLVQNGGIAGSARMADGTPMGHVKVTLRAKQIQGEGAADEFGVYTNSYGLYVFLDMAVDEYSVAVHEGPQLETLELISNVIDGGDDNQTPGTQDVSFATTQSSLILRPFFYDKKAKESTQSVDNSDVQTPEKGETDTTTGDTNGVGGEGSITGEVLSASALDPLGAVGVQLVDTNGDVLQTAMTNEKGVYTFSGLNFGIYEVACPLETTSMGKAFSMVDDPDHNVDGRARHVDVVQSVATRLPPFMFLEKLSSQLTTSGDNGRAVEDTQMLQLDPEVWGSWIAESRACDSTGIGTGTKCGSIIRFAVESCQTNTMYTLKDVAIGCEITQSDSSACQAFSEDSIDITFSVTSDTPCDDTQQHKSIVSEDAQVVTPIVQLYTEGNYATVRTHNKYELGTVMHAGIRLWINDTGNTVEHANIVHIERDSDGACAEYNGMSYGFDLDIKDFTQTFSRASADTFAEIHLELPITPDVVCAVSEQASNTVKFRFTVRVEYTTTDTDGSKNLVRRRRDVPVSFEQDRFTRSTLIDDVTCSVVVLVENTSVNVDRVSESPESATAVTVSLDSKSDAASGTRTSTSSVADTGSSGTSALMIVGIVLGVLVCLCCLCCASMLIVVIVRRRRRKSVLQWEAKQRFITGSSCNMNPDSTVGLSHAF